MDQELLNILEQIAREKGISQEYLMEAVELAVESATKRHLQPGELVEAHFNKETGQIELYMLKKVVEKVEDELTEISIDEARGLLDDIEVGDEIEIHREIEGFGRIAAQAAKQVIVQKVREAEREIVYNYYIERVGQLVNCTMQRYEKGGIILDLGRGEGFIPKKELSPRDVFRRGDRIRAYLMEVKKSAQGPQIILSRTHPNLIRRLFEMEVPEIYEGVVEIKGTVREPGERAKVCVISNDSNVDPVGACVGMKGARVQSIVKELKGENIDIIEWTDDATSFIAHALSPAQVNRIKIDVTGKVAEVIVSDQQLSLAIGKKGQNVRLAARLTGWKIDIKSETAAVKESDEHRKRLKRLTVNLSEIPGIGAKIAALIIEKGFNSMEELAKADPAVLTSIPGIGEAKAKTILERIERKLEEETMEQKKEEEAEEGALEQTE